ncbi:MAG: ribosome-binding factor A [Acidimicrobiales bacterium]
MPPPRPDRSSPRYPRTYRLNQVLREVLAEELERMAERDDQFLTVTGVTVEPDLRNATVWLASLPEEAAEKLEADRIALQAAVARQTRLKRTPRLTFKIDPAVVAGSAIEDAIRRIRQEPGAGAADQGPEPAP